MPVRRTFEYRHKKALLVSDIFVRDILIATFLPRHFVRDILNGYLHNDARWLDMQQ